MEENKVNKRKIYIYFSIFFFICFICLIFPIYSFANRVEPIIMGMPFGMFWQVTFTILQFLGLTLLYYWEYNRGRLTNE